MTLNIIAINHQLADRVTNTDAVELVVKAGLQVGCKLADAILCPPVAED